MARKTPKKTKTSNSFPLKSSALTKKFGESIRIQRKQLGLSQQEVADLALVSVNLLRQVEAGKASAHFDKILDILSAVGLQFQLMPGNQRISFPGTI